jgi:sugar phosphate isomerase/epimerase
MLVLSCTSGSFPELPLDRALARIAWAGFRHVEISVPCDDPFPEASSLLEALEAAGLTLAAVDAGTLRTGDRTGGMESAARIGRCAVLAHAVGANRVICELESDTEAQARTVLRQLVIVLADVPVLLCLRNRPGESSVAWERLERLVTDNPDRLGLALDPGAACRGGWDPLAGWPRFGPMLRHVYVTDAAGASAAPLGMGDVVWEALAARLQAADYSGAVSLRMEEGAVTDPVFAEAELKEARFVMESWFDGAR